MKWTGLNELRETYLSFFESKEHTRLESFPLVPIDDNSLLLVNSGMAPLKKYFLGQATPPSNRITTCQKCIRTPDIERVGKTSRHGTYFEMLGNFSFGDYFKIEATKWAWEFITETLNLPIDRIWVSIYLDDDEAFDIWVKNVGVSPDKIVRLGKEDNFWEIGAGPCGPCSEIYFDRGAHKGCGKADCKVGCDCDRYVEFWNLVFSQFNSDGKGNYEKMEKPNIDTGMGLERLACIMQEVDNLFEVDTVSNIMKHICKISGTKYGENDKTDVSLRIITDHIRSTTFMTCDGVLPSNEGRGYVLRRLLRRAARHGKMLGINENFLYKVCDTVINENRSAYPELLTNSDYIKKVIGVEEESFAKTIDRGAELLNSIIEKILKEDKKGANLVLSGEDAFKLYDTFGFPIDLIKEILEEKSIGIDEEGFMNCMNEQRNRARNARNAHGDLGWVGEEIPNMSSISSVFHGYDNISINSKIISIIFENNINKTIFEGQKASIVLEKTPFYAESGGQASDVGVIINGNNIFEVTSCQKTPTGLFIQNGFVKSGVFNIGDLVFAEVDAQNRYATMRNHTCAHLLQAALIQVLGSHVHQAGQLVDSSKLRFDFTHFSALTDDELNEIELLINNRILEGIYVNVNEMNIDEANKLGALALFGEKYGSTVRVVDISPFSIEFCGGTHVNNTSKIGSFKIISESSVASGVRRIEAVTGLSVLNLIKEKETAIAETAHALKITNTNELVARANAVSNQLKIKSQEIDKLNYKLSVIKLEEFLKNPQDVNGTSIITGLFNDSTPDSLRVIGDNLKDKHPTFVGVLACVSEGKGNFIVVCGKDAVAKGAHAGKIAKEVAIITGGNGGGKPDSAIAGIGNINKINEALSSVLEIVKKYI